MSTNSNSADDKKKWCVMVYFAADIDLEPAAMADLEQMKVAGSSSQVDLLAQINPGGARPIRRYHLQKDTYLQEDLIPAIHPDGEHFLNNVNARKDLIDFVRWCSTQSQAEHYALILWGHGQGWKADNPDPCFVPGAGNPRKPLIQRIRELPSTNIPIMDTMPSSMPVTLLNGETDFLSNNDLRVALAEAKTILGGKNIDILGMDACLMAMGEICCQVDESVDFLIACEDTVPDESWPYDSILKLLVANADRMTAEDFARVVVWKFIFDFGQKRKFVTQSICRLGDDKGVALNNFSEALKQWVETLLVEIKDPETRWAAMVARSQVQSFYMRDYVDIYDYCRLLSINSKSAAVSDACQKVMNALHDPNSANNGSSSGLIVDHGTYGYPLKCSFGLSVFFPCVGQVPSCYAELEFSKRTKWHEFLGVFLTSPEGKTAIFERLPAITTETKPATDTKPESENEWPNVIPDEQPAVVPVSPAQPVAAVVNAPATVVTAAPTASLTSTGVLLMSNGDHAGGNGLKTTYGDVIKTSHGDPIKRPQLPVWMLPNAPKVTTQTVGVAPSENESKPGNCTCGQKHY